MPNNYNFYQDVTHIMDISGIVHNEQERINKKAVGIKASMDSQNRLIFLNQSYSSRMKEYSYMIMIISITLVLLVLVIYLKGILPSILVNVFSLLILTIGFCWAAIIYIGIRNRDSIEFDKLYSQPPKDISGNAISSSANINVSDLFNMNLGTCVGNACCASSGLSYDAVNHICTIGNASISGNTTGADDSFTSGFTLMEQAYRKENMRGNLLPKSDFSSLTFSSYT